MKERTLSFQLKILITLGITRHLNLIKVGQMENRSVKINRKELYEQILSEPVSRLAPKYGISDVVWKKICRKLNVPTFPLGLN